MEKNDASFIEEMTKMVIRPHRQLYTAAQLGPTQFIVKSRLSESHQDSIQSLSQYLEINRKDFYIGSVGRKICVSMFDCQSNNQQIATSKMEFIPSSSTLSQNRNSFQLLNKKDRGSISQRCMIFLHGNSGCRIEGLQYAKFILQFGWKVVAFDFRGSGASDGQFTSMGINQSHDLEELLLYLQSKFQISNFALWGRSMGAVTILYYFLSKYFHNYTHNHIKIDSIVLDSPFSNLRKVMLELANSKISLPDFIFNPIINAINQNIYQKLGFNLIQDLDLIFKLQVLNNNPNKQSEKDVIGATRALFLTSKNDQLIHFTHVEALLQATPFQNKFIHYLNQSHNDTRDENVKRKCADFICLPNKSIELGTPQKKLIELGRQQKKSIDLGGQQKEEVLLKIPRKQYLNVTMVTSQHDNDSRKLKEESVKNVIKSTQGNQSIIGRSHPNIEINSMIGVNSKRAGQNESQLMENMHRQGRTNSVHQTYPAYQPSTFEPAEEDTLRISNKSDNPITHQSNQNHLFQSLHTSYQKHYATSNSNKTQLDNYVIGRGSYNNQDKLGLTFKKKIKDQDNHHTRGDRPTTFHPYAFTESQVLQENLDIPKLDLAHVKQSHHENKYGNKHLSTRAEPPTPVPQVLKIAHSKMISFPQMKLNQQMSKVKNKIELDNSSSNSQKEILKLSLTELRKRQKQEHNKCVMKNSKIIHLKEKASFLDNCVNPNSISLKTEGDVLREEGQRFFEKIPTNSFNFHSNNQISEMIYQQKCDQKRSNNTSAWKDSTVKSLKKSLISRKPNERKNSDQIEFQSAQVNKTDKEKQKFYTQAKESDMDIAVNYQFGRSQANHLKNIRQKNTIDSHYKPYHPNKFH